MPTRFYELTDDMSIQGRWLLGVPRDEQGREIEEPWLFTDGATVADSRHLRLPVVVPGSALDFSRAAFAIPVVHHRVATRLAELAPSDVQFVDATVQGQTESFCILVATQLVKCIDDKASAEVEYWREADGRPEKVGRYRKVAGMRVDPLKAGQAKVFRPWGWSVSLIVGEDIKQALEEMGATGVRFTEV
ncbi:imm11 family protein [Pyxidicoccus xibeiensis]|uniref:imm11 family protein n=1 Tax=Pyxidicoccus xibeiensis TaxID=2906759 RepID=UPI0020A73FEC|nr:DUF1629 domain-containing protein [Pyxidicoccus xibeiensis]MCP3136720.1 hypothetical protein [Pyxidicoccus xibeiensis]